MTKRKRWITFDLDGTVMQNPFAGWVFPEIESIVCSASGQNMQVTDRLVHEHERRIRNRQQLEAYDWDDILKQILSELDLSVQIDIEQLVKQHSVPPKVYLLEDDVIGALMEIKEKGFLLAAATNGYLKYQQPVLEALGLMDVFDKVSTPDQCGCAKPNVAMLKVLDDEGGIAAHVGDRIDHDVCPANELGVTSVWIHRQLPVELQNISPGERNRSEMCLALCREKWTKETKGCNSDFREGCIPDLVVHSLNEIVENI